MGSSTADGSDVLTKDKKASAFRESPPGGIDENSVEKGHTYRVTVSGLGYPRPLPIGGRGGDQEGSGTFFVEVGSARGRKIEIVVLKTGGTL